MSAGTNGGTKSVSTVGTVTVYLFVFFLYLSICTVHLCKEIDRYVHVCMHAYRVLAKAGKQGVYPPFF